MTYESKPGVWVDSYAEIDAYGDFIQNTYMLKGSNKVNDDINALYIISVVVDSYAMENLHYLKYVYYNGISWKIARVKAEYPRLIITLDGDPFEVTSKIPVDRKTADFYANNFLVNMPKLECSLIEHDSGEIDMEITFEPVTDKLLLFYVRNKKTEIRAQLLYHDNRGGWGSLTNELSIEITSTERVRKPEHVFQRSRCNQKSFYGISYVTLSYDNLLKGRVVLNNILLVRNFKTFNSYYKGHIKDTDDYIKPEQNFSCELYTYCSLHHTHLYEESPLGRYNESGNILYYELTGYRKISDNTTTHIFKD